MNSKFLAILLAVTLVGPASTRALAQAPPQGPPQTPYGAPISVENAKKAAAACIVEAQKNKWNVAIAIVDGAGFLVYFERMQNTQLGSVDVAIEKARTSALFRRPTEMFQETLAAGGDGLRVLGLKGVNPNGGGVPIVVEGKIVGAVGISGATAKQDAQVAAAGVNALR